jgi:hypothetical protein
LYIPGQTSQIEPFDVEVFHVNSSIRMQPHIPLPLVAALLQWNFGTCHEGNICYWIFHFKLIFWIDCHCQPIFFVSIISFSVMGEHPSSLALCGANLPCLYIPKQTSQSKPDDVEIFLWNSSVKRPSHIPLPLVAALLRWNFGTCHEKNIHCLCFCSLYRDVLCVMEGHPSPFVFYGANLSCL